MPGNWVRLTRKSDKTLVYLNLDHATLIAPSGTGSTIKFIEHFQTEYEVLEPPDRVMSLVGKTYA
jgi:hypothetical protein